MKFQSVNELKYFDFQDCRVLSAALKDSLLTFETEALIVKRGNSQNRQPFDSYAGNALISFEGVRILKAVKEGYKRYTADDVLAEEVPDRELSADEVRDLGSLLKDAYLYEVEKDHFEEGETVYALEFESPGEDLYDVLDTDNYGLLITFDCVTISWDQYMNRVGG
ncbi:MAG: hypothetical protein IIU47_04945 [Lachnospiraceae bacterium]|nr:hypothetical protein [Lachnospiraceae bacterium]MBQ5360368.1 hypothetical protein [Lachnospiraceae bacterium]